MSRLLSNALIMIGGEKHIKLVFGLLRFDDGKIAILK